MRRKIVIFNPVESDNQLKTITCFDFYIMSVIRISTNFNIDLEFPAAPFHRRLFAWFIDVLVIIFYIYLAFKILNAIDSAGMISDNEGMAALSMLMILPVATYHLFSEIFLNGQSVGKRIMGLRVVNENGGRPSISQFIIRWLIRTSDYMALVIIIYAPVAAMGQLAFFWNVAASFTLLIADIILVNATRKNQRLGDLLAHTMLIRTTQKADINDTIFLNVKEDYTPSFPQVMQLSDRDINALKGILDAAKKHHDYNLAERAAEKIKHHLKIETSMSPFDFLEILLKDYNYLSAN